MRRILFIALLALPLHAHDFWIEPSTFRPAAGATVSTELRVGEKFSGDPVPRRSPRIEQFVVRDAAGERSVKGIENRHPAGFVRMDGAGPAVFAYVAKPYAHEVSAAQFARFLREEGIRNVKFANRVQRERYLRYAKSIVNEPAALVAQPFGWRFELVPDASLETFRLLYEGKPLRDAQVAAISPDGKHVAARTDREGRVRFTLERGVWLVKAVHVVPASSSDFDWESLWASLTFER